MFTRKKKMEINSHEVVDFVRLLGRFGLKFEISNEYCKADDLDPNLIKRYRQFIIYGTRKELKTFCEARDIILNYVRH